MTAYKQKYAKIHTFHNIALHHIPENLLYPRSAFNQSSQACSQSFKTVGGQTGRISRVSEGLVVHCTKTWTSSQCSGSARPTAAAAAGGPAASSFKIPWYPLRLTRQSGLMFPTEIFKASPCYLTMTYRSMSIRNRQHAVIATWKVSIFYEVDFSLTIKEIGSCGSYNQAKLYIEAINPMISKSFRLLRNESIT